MQTDGTLFIDGEWLSGSGEAFSSTNPADGSTLWQGRAASATDVARAVDAARRAAAGWARLPFEERAATLRAYEAVVRDNADSLADAITAETGKPRWETATEVAAVIGKVAISFEAYEDRSGTVRREAAGAVSVTRHKPHGVLAVFGPYNFPAHLPNGHVVPALMAGNTVVFKPSELTPMVGEFMARMWQAAGLPSGVLNLVQGARPTGATLASHDGVDGLLFTGSATTGAYLHEQFGGRPDKILALEMGGNNPLVVMEDADVDGAIYHTIQSAYISAGQRCSCARRLFVPVGAWGDAFVERLADAVRAIGVGPPAGEPQPFIGPLISARAADQMLAAQQSMLDAGAGELAMMQRLDLGPAYVSPGLLEVTGLDLPDEEHFGPLLTVRRFGTFDEAVAGANNTRFGLSAGIFTHDADMYDRFWQDIRAGVVNWNRPTTGASSAAPFGGVGASGNHRPAAYYAADYVAYPVASLEVPELELPAEKSPGL